MRSQILLLLASTTVVSDASRSCATEDVAISFVDSDGATNTITTISASFGDEFHPMENLIKVTVAAPDITACTPLHAAGEGGQHNGTLVVVQRGSCKFSEKAAIAQAAGAMAMIVVNNNDEMIAEMASHMPAPAHASLHLPAPAHASLHPSPCRTCLSWSLLNGKHAASLAMHTPLTTELRHCSGFEVQLYCHTCSYG